MNKLEISILIFLSTIILLLLAYNIKSPQSTSDQALKKAVKEKNTPKIKKILKYKIKDKGGREYRNSTGYGKRSP